MPRRVRCPHCQSASSATVVWSVGGRCPRCLASLDPPDRTAMVRSPRMSVIPGRSARPHP